jgi:hypothetical protein
MRKKRNVLEDHADPLCAELAQFTTRLAADVFAMNPYLAGRWLDQAIDVPQQRRFSAPGQSHDAKDLALRDRNTDIGDGNHAPETLQDLVLADLLAANGGQRFAGTLAEHFPYAFQFDCGRRCHALRCRAGKNRERYVAARLQPTSDD